MRLAHIYLKVCYLTIEIFLFKNRLESIKPPHYKEFLSPKVFSKISQVIASKRKKKENFPF